MLKYCAVLSLCAGVGLAADYITGQGARLVIGQTTFTSQVFGTSSTLLGSVGGLAFANDTLFVADANRLGMQPINNRVLMFGPMSQMLPQPTASIPLYAGRCPVCVGQASMVLGQPDFTTSTPTRTQTGMSLPLGVASDGQVLVVADTANNRVLLWKAIPTAPGQPADIVLGQPDFTTQSPVVVSANSFRAPQGVWVQNGKIFVADTQNNRVLIWNSIPTKNNQAADLVLGSPNFTTIPNQDLTKAQLTAAANTLLTPTSVTSDGTHLIVTDLGFARVLIWNSIPTQNQQAADVEVGQKDFSTAIPNDTSTLCASNGVDSNNNPTYPNLCAYTLSFPRFALSDGTRLYIADGGNDRVLVYNTIPTQNAARADVILGEPDEFSDVITSTDDIFDPNLTQSGADVLATPTSLAWDGTNLYVTDPSNFRILVFTPAQPSIPFNGIRNAASLDLFALGTVILGGTVNPGDTVTLTIQGTDYAYKVVANDTFDTVLTALADLINAGSGDPNVLARPQLGFQILELVARIAVEAGNNITLATTVSINAQITATASGTTLSGGSTASTLAPGTLVAIGGTNLADKPVAADLNANGLPLDMGGVQVYFDGIRAPLLLVSPNQINTQVPFEVSDSNSVSVYVRTVHADGTVTVTDALGIKIAVASPGIFAENGQDPRPAFAYHASSYGTAVISVDGTVTAGDFLTITIEDRVYTYTTNIGDTLASIRDTFISLINANPQERLFAFPAAQFTRIRLRAKVPGPDGNGIAIAAAQPGAGTATDTVVLGGTIVAGDTVTVTIAGVSYTYTITATDTFTSILNGLASLINANTGDVNVYAVAQPQLSTLELVARATSSTAPNTVTVVAAVSTNAQITATASGATLLGGAPGVTATEVLTALSAETCCASRAGARITTDNPALAGEQIYILAAGLGVVLPVEATNQTTTGYQYHGPELNNPVSSVSATAGGLTASILSAGLKVGTIGIYQVVMQLEASIPTNPQTQLTISQDIYTSNIVTIAVYNPNPPSAQ